jgi:CubicO group peptidase (beta-lactamase class C family)
VEKAEDAAVARVCWAAMLRRRDLLLAALSPRPRMKMNDPHQPTNLAPALELLDAATRAGQVRAAVLHVQAGAQRFVHAYGACTAETPFLLASITKPMTATALVALAEAGTLGLDDPVHRHLPEFAGADRAAVTIRQLLNHTSGLPDQLPDNLQLRRRHAPMREFVSGAVRAPLRFRPGTDVAYQSMGFLLAAEIAERLTHRPFRETLQRLVFEPLRMRSASLGLGGRRIEDLARCQTPDDPGGWNSPYWRDFGSPWGGAHGTTADVIQLLRFFAHPEATRGCLRPESARSMLVPSTPREKRDRYGLGWRLGIAGRSPETFGHSGATGVLAWLDPARDLAFVLLTTWPSDQSERALLRPVSDRVSAAF